MNPPRYWCPSHRADPRALRLADRHYNRQHVGAPQFVPPGRCKVFLLPLADALWITSWPFARYTKHAWAGAWICSCFRNESPLLSSDLIRDAVSATRGCYLSDPKWSAEPEPALGMVTFVDSSKTRRKRDPGRCFIRAGFRPCGFTRGGFMRFNCCRRTSLRPRRSVPRHALRFNPPRPAA